MLAGWLAAGLKPSQIIVVEPQPSPDIVALCVAHGVSLIAELPPPEHPTSDRARSPAEPTRDVLTSAVLTPAIMIIAVKPQVMASVFPALASLTAPDTLTISIAAGRSIASFAAHLPRGAAIIRAMPNTPAAIGRGITAMVANAQSRPDQRAVARALLGAVGDVVEIADEALMDAVTAVSGSGPAYVFWLTETMASAGIAAGLPSDVAMQLARATVAGSGALLASAPEDASTLRRNVTSPAGTTAAALDVLMAADGLEPLMTRAIAAATARSKALS